MMKVLQCVSDGEGSFHSVIVSIFLYDFHTFLSFSIID